MRKEWTDGTTLADALSAERARRKITLQQMATEMSTDTTRVSSWLKDSVPRGDYVDAVMDWLETDLKGIGGLIAATLRLRKKMAGPDEQ